MGGPVVDTVGDVPENAFSATFLPISIFRLIRIYRILTRLSVLLIIIRVFPPNYAKTKTTGTFN